MTKKDYQAIAQAIKENLTPLNKYFAANVDMDGICKVNGFINALCNILKADNPRFNADKFREACK